MSGFTDASALAKKNQDDSIDPMMKLWMKHGYPATDDPRATPQPINDPREYGRGATGPAPYGSSIDGMINDAMGTLHKGNHLHEAAISADADAQSAQAQAHTEKDAELTPVAMNALKGAAIPASFLGGPLGIAAGGYLTAQSGLDAIDDLRKGNYGMAALNAGFTALGARQGIKGVKGMLAHAPGPVLPEPGMNWTARKPAETPYHFGGDMPGVDTPPLPTSPIGSGSGVREAPMNTDINTVAEQIGRGFNPKQEIEMSKLRKSPMGDSEAVSQNVTNGGFNPKAEIENAYKMAADARKMRVSAGLPEGPIAQKATFEPPPELGDSSGKMFAAPAPTKSHSTTGTYWADGKEYPMPDVVGKPTPQTDVAMDNYTYKANGGVPKATSSPLAEKAGLIHTSDSLQPRVDAIPPGDAIMEGDQADLRRVLFGGLNEHSNTAGHPRPKDRKPISKSMEGLLQMISNIKHRSKEPQL